MYFHISAMLLAYLTYEAYINFLGDRFASETWRDEKEFFSKKPYQGLEGKLKFLVTDRYYGATHDRGFGASSKMPKTGLSKWPI